MATKFLRGVHKKNCKQQRKVCINRYMIAPLAVINLLIINGSSVLFYRVFPPLPFRATNVCRRRSAFKKRLSVPVSQVVLFFTGHRELISTGCRPCCNFFASSGDDQNWLKIILLVCGLIVPHNGIITKPKRIVPDGSIHRNVVFLLCNKIYAFDKVIRRTFN